MLLSMWYSLILTIYSYIDDIEVPFYCIAKFPRPRQNINKNHWMLYLLSLYSLSLLPEIWKIKYDNIPADRIPKLTSVKQTKRRKKDQAFDCFYTEGKALEKFMPRIPYIRESCRAINYIALACWLHAR